VRYCKVPPRWEERRQGVSLWRRIWEVVKFWTYAASHVKHTARGALSLRCGKLACTRSIRAEAAYRRHHQSVLSCRGLDAVSKERTNRQFTPMRAHNSCDMNSRYCLSKASGNVDSSSPGTRGIINRCIEESFHSASIRGWPLAPYRSPSDATARTSPSRPYRSPRRSNFDCFSSGPQSMVQDGGGLGSSSLTLFRANGTVLARCTCKGLVPDLGSWEYHPLNLPLTPRYWANGRFATFGCDWPSRGLPLHQTTTTRFHLCAPPHPIPLFHTSTFPPPATYLLNLQRPRRPNGLQAQQAHQDRGLVRQPDDLPVFPVPSPSWAPC
jgi:hypothetical protein